MKKKIIIIIAAVALLLIAGILFLVLGRGEKSYRVLKVHDYEGSAKVTREDTGELEPYVNMQLESGDRVTLDTGTFCIKADEDKFIYLDEHTELQLEATGDSRSSRTKLKLISGGITNDIKNKLTEDSTYEVNTPNATMSVRGTIFYVCIYEENGVKYTKVSVFQGSVATRLVYEDGTQSDEEVLVEKGKEVLIYNDSKTTDYVSEPKDIKYEELPENVLRLLEKLTSETEDLSITKAEIDKVLNGPFVVTFVYDGKVFASQIVAKGAKAVVPDLKPTEDGAWDPLIEEPVNKNVTIEWHR